MNRFVYIVDVTGIIQIRYFENGDYLLVNKTKYISSIDDKKLPSTSVTLR